MMFISVEFRGGGGGAACGGWADFFIARLSSTKYILSWSGELLNQDIHIIVLVHGYRNLQQVPKTTKANAAPKHNALSGSVISIQSAAGLGSPDKHPPITLSNGHPEIITEDDPAQWPMIVHCPVLNHLDQRTPVLGWCRTRMSSRTGSILVGACFTETTDDISYSSLTATQMGSYPTLRKTTFTQCNYFGPFLGRQIKTCIHEKNYGVHRYRFRRP